MKAIVKKYIVVALCLTSYCHAWGVIGHRVVGEIAQNHLSEKAAIRINEITSGLSLADISTWADDIKSDPDPKYKSLTSWHYIEAFRPGVVPASNNVITGIKKSVAILKAKGSDDKFEALALLVHLVGDIHQPLHVYDDHRGANNCYVNWFSPRIRTNLHRVWDSMLINSLRLSYTEYADMLDHISELEIVKVQNSSVKDWANESKALHSKIYPEPTDNIMYSYCDTKHNHVQLPTLGHKYIYTHRTILDDRLRKAGIRLAGLLNNIFGM